MKRSQMTILAVLASFAIVVAVLVGMTITSGNGRANKSSHAPASQAFTTPQPASIATATTAAEQGDESAGRLAPPGEADARLVARRFLRAFTSYEVGAIGRRVRREVLATSAPALSATLLGRPPRSVHAAHPAADASVADLAVAGTGTGGSIEYLADLDRGGTRESFSLTVTPAAGEWRVARLNGA